jgi:transposase InsO family protein
LLHAAKLSRSTFYYQAKAQQGEDRSADLKNRIREVYDCHKGRYGYRRITAELCRSGCKVNHKTVQRLMQLQGLKSLVRPKKYRSYRGEFNANVPNILDRKFLADRPNSKWVTDVTEFNVRGAEAVSLACAGLVQRGDHCVRDTGESKNAFGQRNAEEGLEQTE